MGDYKIIILSHLVLIFLFYDWCYGKVNIVSSDIVEKSSNLLGVELNYAYANIQLDSDLVRYDTLACENYECPIDSSIITPDGVDCSCDYTESDQCPKKLDPVACGGKVCPEFASDGVTPMCYGNWEKIDQGKQYIRNSLDGQVLNFRYKANARICESLLVVVYPIVGFFKGGMGGTPITTLQRNLPSIHVQSYNVMNLCPTDNQPYTTKISWTQDTYYITIEPIGPNVTFSIQIYSNETFSPPPPTSSTCQQVLQDSQCIMDGKSITDEIQGPAFKYYTFQVSKANYYYFGAPALYQDINLFISDNSSLPYPTISNPGKWQSVEEYDDYLMIYLEPINSTHPLTLYIGVYCSYQSKFTLTVTSNGYKYPVAISSLPVNAGAYSLTKSSRLILSDGTTYNCASWYLCFPFSIQFPLLDGIPVWPVSTYFLSDNTFRNINFEDSFLNNSFNSNSYQASFLLSASSGSSSNTPYIYQTLDVLLNSKIEFLSTLFNSLGQPLDGIYGFKKKELVCNYKEFKNVLDAIEKTEDVLFSVSDLNQLNDWRYRLDSLTFRDSWIACYNDAKSLLDTSQEVKVNISSIFCPFGSNDPLYATDPCCNSSLAFFQCCNPKQVEITQTQFTGTHDNLIENQCSSFECTQSVLSDFYKSISSVDSCSVSSFKTQSLKNSVIQVLRDCKNDYDTFKYCDTDRDCQEFSAKKCDLFTRNCLIDFQLLDKSYIECVLNNIPPSTLYGLAQVSPSNITNSIIDQLYDSNQQDDCISESSYPIRQMMIYTSDNIPKGRCYPPSRCLDQSCELEHDVCFDQVYTNFQLYPWLDLETCETIGFCPVVIDDSCGPVDFQDSTCSQQCNLITSYCGHCSSNDTYCHQISDYTDKSTCESKSACLLPSGGFVLDIDKEQCEQYGLCTGYCGYSCGSGFGCIIEGAQNEIQCSSHSNSQWIPGANKCTFNTASPTVCSNNSYKWYDCSAESVGECSSLCPLTPKECPDQNQCQQSGGECSDLFFFSQENTINYRDGMGKCVRGHFEYRTDWYPSCNFESENDSPLGCYDHTPNYLNKSSCEAAGNKWWTLSANKDQCVSHKGCKTLDLNSDSMDFNFRFNQMNEQQCTSCYQSQNEWTTMFEWSSATWIKGVYIDNLSWIQDNQFKIIAKQKKAFSYQKFYSNIIGTVDTQIADLLRSESFCKLKRIQSSLNSVSCSCYDDDDNAGGAKCFKSSVPLIGQTKPCFGESSVFEFDYGQLEFQQNSIINLCASLLVSQISKENHMAAVPLSLSSNFVDYNVIDKYGVLNDRGAIVGILLSDGISIKAQFANIKSLTVCFKVLSESTSSQYPTFDFATTNENEEPVPLNQDIFKLDYSNSTSIIGRDLLLCSNFTQSDFNLTKNDEILLFPIVRSNNWENQSRQVFDKSTRGLIFTLATFYLLVGIWGLYQIGYIINRQRVSGIYKVQLVHILIFIVTVFIIIRSVYFYVLGKGHLAFNPVGDYILVVLPTFLYFTAFTIIVILFYVLVYLSYRSADSSKRIFKMVFLINVIIYLLFIACALVFKKTQNIPTNDCGSRIIIPMSSSIPQKAISITYAVVQCVISVVLGASFVYLGIKLYLIMRRTKKTLSKSANDDAFNRIFLQTSICSVGFILHCIFILVLVTGGLNTIAFSFIALIITEIIPCICLLWCYDPRHKNQKKEISMNSSHNNTSDY